jgi:hypothetical protein
VGREIQPEVEVAMGKNYQPYIINRATWTLFSKYAVRGEKYDDFLKRVYEDYDVDAACDEELLLDRLDSLRASPRMD